MLSSNIKNLPITFIYPCVATILSNKIFLVKAKFFVHFAKINKFLKKTLFFSKKKLNRIVSEKSVDLGD